MVLKNNQSKVDIKTQHAQFRFASGLAGCSQALVAPAVRDEEKVLVFAQALEQLRRATESSRAFLYRNVDDPESGFGSELVSVAHDPHYPADAITSRMLRKIPWSMAPECARNALEAGQPFGGAVDKVFASEPDFLRAVKEENILSVQFFPIHLQGHWWGYIGFDECHHARQWTEAEIMLLGTAAELFANTLHRWQTETALRRQKRHEEALSNCSRALLQIARSEAEQTALLNQALEYLRQAVNAGRAYLFENFEDPELGLCTGMQAEVCAPDVDPHIGNPANQRTRWSQLPPEMRHSLETGRAFGGPVDQSFASAPQLAQAFKEQRNPLLSVQLFPIHFGTHWWGFIGYDDVASPREWGEEEIRTLRIASEMIGNTIQRWRTETELQSELDERRRQEERLRLLESVVVNTSEAVIITEAEPIDLPGPRILYVNDAFIKTTGYSAEEVVGLNPRFLQGPRTSRQQLDRLRQALERQEELVIELINYRKDGSEFWVEISISPVFNEEGSCTHFVAVQRDVTERRRVQQALREARDQLEIRVAERTRELSNKNEQLRQEVASRMHAEAEVRQRLAVEQSLADISTRLVKTADSRTILPEVLRDVATMVGARRVALIFFEDSKKQVGDIYEWCSEDTEPLESTFLSIHMPSFAWMWQQLQDNQAVLLANLDHIPASAVAEKQIIQERGTESIAAIPLQVDGKLAAVLVCSNFVGQDSAITRQLDILNVVADLLGTMLQREALLDSLEQRAIDRTRELTAFYDMTMLASEAENLSDILEPTLDHIIEVARCQAVSIHELSADGKTLYLVAQHGLDQDEVAELAPLADRFAEWFHNLNEPILEDELGESELLPPALRPAGIERFLGAQLRARGKALGILSCYRRTDRGYSLNTTALVVALAEQLGIIIENYRLRQRAEEGVIIEERQRLARDLHDAITQSIYAVTLFARSSVDALEAGNIDKANETLQEVEQNALFAQKEMRLLLHQLQPLALEEGGLQRAIDSRLNQVERRLGITASLAISEGLLLRPRPEESVYRIVTEALNNSLKYADATEISISLQENEGHLRLEVKDNGCGFDPAMPKLGMGISNMQERVAILHGRFTLTSAPGHGTIISVDLPAECQE